MCLYVSGTTTEYFSLVPIAVVKIIYLTWRRTVLVNGQTPNELLDYAHDVGFYILLSNLKN